LSLSPAARALISFGTEISGLTPRAEALSPAAQAGRRYPRPTLSPPDEAHEATRTEVLSEPAASAWTDRKM